MSSDRPRVFILAASRDQAHGFIQRWLAEDPTRRLQDAVYLGSRAAMQGRFVTDRDRVVAVEGHYRHRHAGQIEHELRRALAKTGKNFDPEHVSA
ncbi:MAG TPA: hypothetical protein VGK43_01365 [Solirubrobacterales bacterium]